MRCTSSFNTALQEKIQLYVLGCGDIYKETIVSFSNYSYISFSFLSLAVGCVGGGVEAQSYSRTVLVVSHVNIYMYCYLVYHFHVYKKHLHLKWQSRGRRLQEKIPLRYLAKCHIKRMVTN